MKKIILILMVVLMVLFTVSCKKPEEATVTKYFQAMAHGPEGDIDTMQSMAVYPVHIAKVKSYKITNITEEKVEDYKLQGLLEDLAKITKEKKEQTEKVLDLNGQVEDLGYDIEDAKSKKKKKELGVKLEALKKEQEVEKNKIKEINSRETNAKRAIEQEQNYIRKSSGMEENLESFSGKIYTNEVYVDVTTEDGNTTPYIIQLLRYQMQLPGAKKERKGRRIIIQFVPASEFGKVKKAAPAKKVEPEATKPAEEEKATADTKKEDKKEEKKVENKKKVKAKK